MAEAVGSKLGTRSQPAAARSIRPWVIVARQELRDLWLRGRGLPLMLAFSVLLSVVTYLSASNKSLNFLERHEAVSLTLQVAVAVGALLALLVAADAISGERERGTLEGLMLTPAPRRELMLGKLLAALSIWLVAFLITVPYVWFLGRGVGIVGEALAVGFGVGTLLALAFTALGVTVSTLAGTNRLSLSISLFVLLALYAPTLFPTGGTTGWFGEFLQRANPLTAGEHYIGNIVIDQHPASQDASWLTSPIVAAAVLLCIAVAVAPRLLRLRGGEAA